MARPRKGIIYNLEQVLAQLLKTNDALNARLAQMEAILIGGAAPVRRGRKPGRKRGRKPGRKPGRKVRTARRGRRPRAAKLCSMPGCGRPHYAKGLCASHYQTARREAKEKKSE